MTTITTCSECHKPCDIVHDLDMSDCCRAKTYALNPKTEPYTETHATRADAAIAMYEQRVLALEDALLPIKRLWWQFGHLDCLLSDTQWTGDSVVKRTHWEIWQGVVESLQILGLEGMPKRTAKKPKPEKG
jgi:hypothetical protein